MSLRFKLLLAASALFVVPLVGYRYIIAMEQFLREHQAQAVLESAHTLALTLAGQERLFPSAEHPEHQTLFVHPIESSLDIDGYDKDWATLAIAPHAAAFNLRAASDSKALFLLLSLRVPSSSHRSSQLRLILEDAPAFRRAWLLDASSPGAMAVREVPPGTGLTQPAHPDTRLQAATQSHGDRLLFEIRIPISLGIAALSFEVLAPSKKQIPQHGKLFVRFAPRELGATLRAWTPAAGRRLRVIDGQARVIAQAGNLTHPNTPITIMAALEQFVDSNDDPPLSLAPVTLKLTGAEVDTALAGHPAVRVRRIAADGPLVVSAAYPLHANGQLLGALILEENTSPSQAVARDALFELFLAASGAFVFGASALLLVSGRVVARLRGLRDQAAEAVDTSGRVLTPFRVANAADEIGDLGRSFGAAVSRLQGYQDYLEKLAQRLSHELRTPLTIIRSSLDNLSMGDSIEQREIYIERAQRGVERLESIVRRMSEAARLEQAMAQTECTRFDLCSLLHSVLPAYQQSWPDNRVELHISCTPCVINGCADLIVQALDKLLSNARDFADSDSTITIELSDSTHGNERKAQLLVCNTGARLPAGDPAQLFESMNSQRANARYEPLEAHLGFGLYVVRLIAEFHGGKAVAFDDPHSRVVRIGMQLGIATD